MVVVRQGQVASGLIQQLVNSDDAAGNQSEPVRRRLFMRPFPLVIVPLRSLRVPFGLRRSQPVGQLRHVEVGGGRLGGMRGWGGQGGLRGLPTGQPVTGQTSGWVLGWLDGVQGVLEEGQGGERGARRMGSGC